MENIIEKKFKIINSYSENINELIYKNLLQKKKSNTNRVLKIGVLGGIGPLSSVAFYNRIIRAIQLSNKFDKNQEYPNIIINNIPAQELVDINPYYNDSEALKDYIKGLKDLALLTPDFIIMVCNTIHNYYKVLVKKSGFPHIISIRELVYAKTHSSLKNNKKINNICVLGTPSTIKLGLYQFEGINYISLSEVEMKRLANIISDYTITGKLVIGNQELMNILTTLFNRGADLFILGCTELSLLVPTEAKYQFIDPLNLLVDYCLSTCINYHNIGETK